MKYYQWKLLCDFMCLVVKFIDSKEIGDCDALEERLIKSRDLDDWVKQHHDGIWL